MKVIVFNDSFFDFIDLGEKKTRFMDVRSVETGGKNTPKTKKNTERSEYGEIDFR